MAWVVAATYAVVVDETLEVVLACAAPLPVADAERVDMMIACVEAALNDATDEVVAEVCVESEVVRSVLVVLEAVAAVVAVTARVEEARVLASDATSVLETQVVGDAKPMRP